MYSARDREPHLLLQIRTEKSRLYFNARSSFSRTGAVCASSTVDAMGGNITFDNSGTLVTSKNSFWNGKPVAWGCFNGSCIGGKTIAQCNPPGNPITSVVVSCGGEVGIDHILGCPAQANPPSSILGLSGMPGAGAGAGAGGAVGGVGPEAAAAAALLAAPAAFDLIPSVQERSSVLCSAAATSTPGPRLGVRMINFKNFRPYLPTPPFSSFVSGHSAFSAAGAEILRNSTGTDAFGGSFTATPGSSLVEPGLTPTAPVTLSWATFPVPRRKPECPDVSAEFTASLTTWLGVLLDEQWRTRCGTSQSLFSRAWPGSICKSLCVDALVRIWGRPAMLVPAATPNAARC
jgi:hypothetical protein